MLGQALGLTDAEFAALRTDEYKTSALFDEREKAGGKRGNLLTSDGVHMNPRGNMMMAAGVLKGFGLEGAALAKAKDAWLDIPGGATVSPQVKLTLRELQALEAAAAKSGKSIQALLQEALEKEVRSLLGK